MRRSGRRPKLWFCQFGHHQRGTRPPQPKRIAAKWAVLRFDGPVDREIRLCHSGHSAGRFGCRCLGLGTTLALHVVRRPLQLHTG